MTGGQVSKVEQRGELRFLVWWTSQQDCRIIGPDLPASFPLYLRAEYGRRFGRAGRGRLWIASGMTGRIEQWAYTPLGLTLVDCGGIVIEASDARHLATIPGMITDMRLRRP